MNNEIENTPDHSGVQVPTHINDDEKRWGPWRFEAKTTCLVFDPRNEVEAGSTVAYRASGYYIDLRECMSAHQILHWVGHLLEKVWITPRVIGHLVRAFDDLLDLRHLEAKGVMQ